MRAAGEQTRSSSARRTFRGDLGSRPTTARTPPPARRAAGSSIRRPERLQPGATSIPTRHWSTPGLPTPVPTSATTSAAPLIGVLDYDFGNFELELTLPLTTVADGVTREVTAEPGANELTVATFNVENLDALDAAVEVRRARGRDRQQHEVARRHFARRDPGQQRRDERHRRRCRPDAEQARCGDQGRRRSDVRLAADQSGRRSGRRRAGWEHPGRLHVPHRSRPRLRRPARR